MTNVSYACSLEGPLPKPVSALHWENSLGNDEKGSDLSGIYEEKGKHQVVPISVRRLSNYATSKYFLNVHFKNI